MLFERKDIQEGLEALVDELVASGVSSNIHIVGSAAIILQIQRQERTSDVDALQFPAPRVKEAIERVALSRRWPLDWLNDAANMFASHFDSENDWNVLMSKGDVTLYVATAPLLLAMKLNSGRGRRDAPDIELLLDACGIDSTESAMAIFDRYFPTDVMPKINRNLLQRRFSEAPEE